MNIEIKYNETDKTQMVGCIERIGEKFICDIYLNKGFDNDSNRSLLNGAIERYIKNKSIIKIDENYVVCWEKIKFRFTEEQFLSMVYYGIKAHKKINKTILKI